MNIVFSENHEAVISASWLSSFAAEKVRTPLNFRQVGSIGYEPDYMTELSHRLIRGKNVYILTAEHDGIFCTNKKYTVEKIKRVKRISPFIGPLEDAQLLAKGFIAAFLLCKVKSLSDVTLKVTFESNDDKISWDIALKLEYLTSIVDSLLDRALPFAEVEISWLSKGPSDIKNMPFPFSTMREGQRDFINAVFRCAKRGTRLLAEAPTGIGKTVSALFPAVKAVGEGIAEKIFYLTAKGVTGKNALEAVASMARHAPDLRGILIIAKDRCCPFKKKDSAFRTEGCALTCPKMCDNADGTYKSRRNRAILELLEYGSACDSDHVRDVAERFDLCPYELSLDLSEYCQVIICDYNYVFDTRVRFRRYFVTGKQKYILLADEAHNLPDRAREMYCAHLDQEFFKRLSRSVSEYLPSEVSLLSKLEGVLPCFEKIKELCRENYDGQYGYFIENTLPKEFNRPFKELLDEAKRVRKYCDRAEVIHGLDKLISDISDLFHSLEFFDESFVVFGETRKESALFKIVCLDPSKLLDSIMSGAVSSVLFSATLSPIHYFADILGCPKAETLELDSPFDPDNLAIAAVDTVSTKYSAREGTALSIAELILTAVSAKEGNYLVYFPSYKYMKDIVREFLNIAPESIRAVMQKPDMSLASREKFLSFFNDKGKGTLVGFCVLGGLFSEGIDLPSERLIGVVLVGIGLPGLSSELNLLRDYYDKTREDGYNFAYVYPGIIKVLQAAGRVIRGEEDRGVVVLIDERYADASIRKILPSHWKAMKYVGNSHSLHKYLKDFWKN